MPTTHEPIPAVFHAPPCRCERCAARPCNEVPPGRYGLPCILPSGHADHHRNADDILWRNPRGRTGASLLALLLGALLSLPAFAAEPCRINVNAATTHQLQLFARTGPVLAGRLASGRPFKALKDVDAVKGVGDAWLAVNGPHVAFSGPTTCTAKIPTPKAPKAPAPAPLP